MIVIRLLKPSINARVIGVLIGGYLLFMFFFGFYEINWGTVLSGISFITLFTVALYPEFIYNPTCILDGDKISILNDSVIFKKRLDLDDVNYSITRNDALITFNCDKRLLFKIKLSELTGYQYAMFEMFLNKKSARFA
jgi:hypothetical protein